MCTRPQAPRSHLGEGSLPQVTSLRVNWFKLSGRWSGEENSVFHLEKGKEPSFTSQVGLDPLFQNRVWVVLRADALAATPRWLT